jgi:uroporphyrinogen III methyltransferase/synthase
VRNFKAILEGFGLDPARLPGSPRIACIGPITAQTALELGLPADLVAEEYTIEGLFATLQRGPSAPSQSVRIMP